jgi:phosphotriesterase-related protein
MSIEEYQRYMLDEIENGIEDTDIKPGHIKAAMEGGPTEQEVKFLKAVARVSQETGLSASIHTGIEHSFDQVRHIAKIVLDEGIAPERTLMCHMQNSLMCMEFDKLVHDPSRRELNLSLNRELLDRGLNVGHDCFGMDFRLDICGLVGAPEWANIAAIYELCKSGYAGQITLATDTYLKIYTRRFGGGGYCYLTNTVLPTLERVGVKEADLAKMTVENPARLLARQ